MSKLDGDNLERITQAARTKARKTGRTFYVIREPDHTGYFHACDEHDLDTFYAGTSDQNILYCTAD